MRTMIVAVALTLLGGCCNCKQPIPPAPLPQSPALGWKVGTLGEGCTIVKVGTHYEMKCPTDKPGDKPFICWVEEDRLRCKQ